MKLTPRFRRARLFSETEERGSFGWCLGKLRETSGAVHSVHTVHLRNGGNTSDTCACTYAGRNAFISVSRYGYWNNCEERWKFIEQV